MRMDTINLADVQEPKPVEEEQYKMQVVSSEDAVSKKNPDREFVKACFRILDVPNAPLVNEILCYPLESDAPNIQEMFALNLKRYCTAFDVPFSGMEIDHSAAEGNTGFVILKIEEQDGYDPANKVKRWLKPQD